MDGKETYSPSVQALEDLDAQVEALRIDTESLVLSILGKRINTILADADCSTVSMPFKETRLEDGSTGVVARTGPTAFKEYRIMRERFVKPEKGESVEMQRFFAWEELNPGLKSRQRMWTQYVTAKTKVKTRKGEREGFNLQDFREINTIVKGFDESQDGQA